MPDGWFPVLSPSGRRVMRGSEVLSLDDVTLPDQPKGGIAGAWLDENTIVYRTHLDPGELRRRTLTTGEDVLLAGPTSWVSAGGGVVAWCETPAGGATRIVAVSPGGRREWDGYGGGWAPVHVASNGWVFFGHHERGGLYWVPPGETTPVLLTALPARLVRSSLAGVTWEADGRVYVADWATLEPRDVTLPGEVEHGPVLVDTPAGPWLVTHTDRRLLARPLGRTTGVVLDESGDTYYPDAAWWPGDDARPEGVRVCWSQGLGPKGGSAGTPHDRVVPLDAPLVDLRPSAQWLPVGTQVDLMPFIAASYEGVLRCPEDGQTLQTVRTGPKEFCCLKGAPERQERWRFDDTAVYLTYDATDGREGRPWRIAPEPTWCRRSWTVGAAWYAPTGTRLVRRTLDGRSEAHPFPLRTRLHAAGEHVEVRGVGRCRVAVTTWEPGWPDSGYEERHWWAIRESDGLRLGRVRYEEWRRGVLERSFDFSELLPDQRLEPAPMLAIPDPPAPIPDPTPQPEPEPMPPTIQPPPRDDVLECLTWLRHEVYPGLVGYPLDDEGIAAWLVDTYTVDGRLRRGLPHEAAKHHTFAAIERVVHPAAPAPRPETPPPAGAVEPLVIDRATRTVRTADGRLLDYREASQFMLLALFRGQNGGSPAAAREVIRHMRARHRCNVLRVFVTIGHPDFWVARGWRLHAGDAGLYDDMAALTATATAEGVRLRWTLLADTPWTCPTVEAQRSHVQASAAALAPFVDQVIVEVANEPTMNGFGGEWAATLADLARRLDPRFVIALGPEHGATGHLATADRDPADLVYFHAERVTSEAGWAWVRRLSEYGVVLNGERPVGSGEPVNAGHEGAPGDFLRDPAIWFAYGALSRVVPQAGYLPTMHYDDGLFARVPEGPTVACFDAFHAGCDAVPLAAKLGRWVNGHWAEAPWRGYDQTDPPSDDRPSRIFGRLVDGRYWGVSIREPKGWAWRDLRYPVERVARAEGERFDCSVWRAA